MDAIIKNFLALDNLAKELEEIDPRRLVRVEHSAHTILLITLAGVFAKCQTWNEIADYGRMKLALLQQFIPGLTLTPSHDTFRRFFSIVDPMKLEGLYRQWAKKIQSTLPTSSQRHIAIDGKRLRSAAGAKSVLSWAVEELSVEEAGKINVHMVSAYDVTNQMSLAQEQVPEKTNEITADKILLEALDLHEGDLVTMDAMGTQTENVRLIREKKADYLLEVKENHKHLYQAIVQSVKENRAKGVKLRNDKWEDFDEKGHGFLVSRECYTVGEKYMLGKEHRDWMDLRTFGLITIVRTNKTTGQTTTTPHYFITSLGKDAKELIRYKRAHWQVENALHRTLDVEFNEDNSQKKMTSAVNYSLITKMVMAILKNNQRKLPLSRKRLAAGWDDFYMKELLEQFINAYK
jgi:predicted transposase YbfD/YdcC